MSQITTHVLDTAKGRPAAGIRIQLQNQSGKTIAQGSTNEDGRIGDLLEKGLTLPPGIYQIHFDTGSYFKMNNLPVFYPGVMIQFTIFDNSHYHIPLLLSPFGYSTYRGS